MSALPLADAQGLWRPERVYLNTATYGLPPEPAWEALQAALADWHGGRTSFEPWMEATEVARREFATLTGAAAEDVAVGSAVSGLVGQIAASLPDGAKVLAPDMEFTSLVFPFMAQGRGVTVELVPLDRLAEGIDGDTALVAFSAVQSSSGDVAALGDISAAARHHGALTVVDGSQACGWLPLDAARFDIVAAGAYKWLMSPRGTALMTVRRERLGDVVPIAAGWYAAEDVHSSYIGPEMRLASDARRLDTSPAWFSWVGTQPALELVEAIGVETIHAHDVALANRFRAGLGLEPSGSAIVTADLPGAAERLERAGIVVAIRGGRLRASWHVYNTEADVDRVLDVLTG
jgi:selenocysteine lyase/cysteine desulfurase